MVEQREILGKDFKIYGDTENPLFLAKDIAELLGNKDVTSMMRSVDEDEKTLRVKSGDARELWCLTEDGLYEALMSSRKPIAKAFKKKIKEILRTIRKTGHYETQEYKAILELQANQERMEKLLIDSGVLRTNVSPRHTFDRLNVRYKIATGDDNIRGLYDAIGNYFGINVPYSNNINVTVKDWILAKMPIDDIQEFVIGIETAMIVKSLRGHYVNLHGFDGNTVEWEKILDYYGHQCAYCGADDKALIPEHIICQSYLSQSNPEAVDLIGNICCTCVACNKSKNKADLDEWYPTHPQFKQWRLEKIHKQQAKYRLEV